MNKTLTYFLSCFMLVSLTKAGVASFSSSLKNWPSFALQNEIPEEEKDAIEFEEADFKAIEKKIIAENEPMIPLNTKRQFTELVTLDDPDIRWRVFMSAFTGSNYSGFSQGVGGTTMLIEDKLILDVEVAHVQFNRKDDKYQSFEGDKYRVNTMLHWFPTDFFSMHLGFNGWVDK